MSVVSYKMYNRLYILSLFLMLCNLCQAQMKITGQVYENKRTPLAQVTVFEKGTSNGVPTDAEGHFEITVSGKNAVLVFRYLGYETQEKVVVKAEHITIRLKPLFLGIYEPQPDLLSVGISSGLIHTPLGLRARIPLFSSQYYPKLGGLELEYRFGRHQNRYGSVKYKKSGLYRFLGKETRMAVEWRFRETYSDDLNQKLNQYHLYQSTDIGQFIIHSGFAFLDLRQPEDQAEMALLAGLETGEDLGPMNLMVEFKVSPSYLQFRWRIAYTPYNLVKSVGLRADHFEGYHEIAAYITFLL